jgi:hypothetical protein
MADKLIIHKPAADMTTKLSIILKGTSAFLLLLCVFAFTQSVLTQGVKKGTQVQLLSGKEYFVFVIPGLI